MILGACTDDLHHRDLLQRTTEKSETEYATCILHRRYPRFLSLSLSLLYYCGCMGNSELCEISDDSLYLYFYLYIYLFPCRLFFFCESSTILYFLHGYLLMLTQYSAYCRSRYSKYVGFRN